MNKINWKEKNQNQYPKLSFEHDLNIYNRKNNLANQIWSQITHFSIEKNIR